MPPDKIEHKDPAAAQAELAWWNEERDRLNVLAKTAHAQGSQCPETLVLPPALNEDGTLAGGEVADNAFCPTGPGGGIDPTCSPVHGGSAHSSSPPLKGKEAEKMLLDHVRKANLGLSVETAIGGYTGDFWKETNAQMRKCPPKFECVDEYTRNILATVRSAEAKAGKLPQPVTAYRWVFFSPGTEGGLVSQAQQNLDSGKTFNMPSLTSFSVDERWPDSFKNPGGVMFQATTRSGLYVDPFSYNKGEKELLQSPDVKYKVTRVERNLRGQPVIHIEEVD